MEIEAQVQIDTDFDWFCLDSTGAIGHFTTAGFKRLPRSVTRSSEDLQLATHYFKQEAVGGRGYRVDDDLAQDRRGDRYLRDFVEMADRGLFSFDINPYVEPELSYFRVASPSHPLRLIDLPQTIREIVQRTVLPGKALSERSTIPYDETLRM